MALTWMVVGHGNRQFGCAIMALDSLAKRAVQTSLSLSLPSKEAEEEQHSIFISTQLELRNTTQIAFVHSNLKI